MAKVAAFFFLAVFLAAPLAEAKPKKPVRRPAPRGQNCVRPFYYGAAERCGPRPFYYGTPARQSDYGFYSL